MCLVEIKGHTIRTIFASNSGSALTDKEAMDALFGSLIIAEPGEYTLWIATQEYSITKKEPA